MKKLFLVATIVVAGLVSAKDSVVSKTIIKEKAIPKKETVKKTKVAAGCVPVSYSCGVRGWACGSSFMEMIQNAWDGDSLFCG